MFVPSAQLPSAADVGASAAEFAITCFPFLILAYFSPRHGHQTYSFTYPGNDGFFGTSLPKV